MVPRDNSDQRQRPACRRSSFRPGVNREGLPLALEFLGRPVQREWIVDQCRRNGLVGHAPSPSLSLTWPAASCAQVIVAIDAAACAKPAAGPVAISELPGDPFQAIPTSDGCHVFVSLAGPTEPSDPRRPPRSGASSGGVAVVSRVGGEPSLIRVMQLEGSPWGMALTQDDGLLIVASDDRVALHRFRSPDRRHRGRHPGLLEGRSDGRALLCETHSGRSVALPE